MEPENIILIIMAVLQFIGYDRMEGWMRIFFQKVVGWTKSIGEGLMVVGMAVIEMVQLMWAALMG
jgi:hypothetical protein